MRFTPMRMFSSTKYKGTENYINTQRTYEILRTVIYFAISLSLFIAGYVTTQTRMNLLTVVAVVGCLPGCKSLIGVIMFLRYKSCSKNICDRIKSVNSRHTTVFDMIFTSYDINFNVGHMVIAGNTVCGFTEDDKFNETAFQKHIQNILKMDGHKNVSIKIYKDLDKYIDRISQLNELEADPQETQAVTITLKSVTL